VLAGQGYPKKAKKQIIPAITWRAAVSDHPNAEFIKPAA
jgi:hypothetical protein